MTRPLRLSRYVLPPQDAAVVWKDEDVVRIVRSAILAHDVQHGRAKIGAHHRTLKDFSAALARFGSVVAGGAKEIRRRGHRDILKASAYAHAVKGERRS